MGWAAHYIAKLQNGQTVSFRPRGHSMSGKIESGQLCTVEPVNPATVKVGDPRKDDTLIGPLIDEAALDAMRSVLGEDIEELDPVPGGHYVRPAILEVSAPQLDDVVRLEDAYGREGTSAP